MKIFQTHSIENRVVREINIKILNFFLIPEVIHTEKNYIIMDCNTQPKNVYWENKNVNEECDGTNDRVSANWSMFMECSLR